MSEPKYLTIQEAAKQFPVPVTAETVRRKILLGCRGIRLQAIYDGKRYYTTKQWIDEHITQLSVRRCAYRPVQPDFELIEAEFRSLKKQPKAEQ